MDATATAEHALREGDLARALQQLQAGVRAQPADVRLRIFLFQLLCVQQQWGRALAQLKVCGELSAATLPMVNTYREAIACEAVREAVFQGRTTPLVLGQPQPWVAHLVQALAADAQGQAGQATRLRAEALTAAPASTGSLNGQPMAWLADADSRLGPLLEVIVAGRYGWLPLTHLARLVTEPPADLRDLVWQPATLTFANGGQTVALMPSRYAPLPPDADPMLLLARRTEWLPLADGQYRGLGQRQWVTDQTELGQLALRELALEAP